MPLAATRPWRRRQSSARPGRVLTEEDIDHYQKIVVALSEMIRIMGEIDEVIEEHGGWPKAFQSASVSVEAAEPRTPFA